MQPCRRSAARAEGQALPLMVLAMIALIAMTGAIIDGGNAWANQRGTQNGSDAAAEAGAVVLARKLANAVEPAGGWDANVQAAVEASATANNVTITGAYYTDICGIPLTSEGRAALTGSGVYNFALAKEVGEGMPAATSDTPDCPNFKVGPVAGVLVVSQRNVSTYFSGIVGIHSIPITTQSTAAAGLLQESCAATQGEACGMLPIAVPVSRTRCDGSGNATTPQDSLPTEWSADGQTVYVIPLCKNGPGNVGYIDWTPTAGGTSELIDSIYTPSNPAVALPSWQWISATGNMNTAALEDAIRTYDGQLVLVPEFDITCSPKHGETPDNTQVGTAPLYGCPSGDLGGTGATQWYRIPSFAHLRLCSSSRSVCQQFFAAHGINTAIHGSYISGTSDVCGLSSDQNSTSCLVGTFESVIRTGTIGAGVGG
ncbi:MAG: Tad domain-containing protein, partial [Chloroflexota bacterium]